MKEEKIDQLLADWKQKLDLVGQNLIDLHGLVTYQRLCGVSGFPKTQLTGVTEVKVTSALAVMNDLFQHFDLLLLAVDKAVQLRASIPRFLGSQQKIQEIEDLLKKPSIRLSVVQIPLAQRGLLSAAQTENAIAPEDLLNLMINAFQVGKDAVLAVEQAWLNLELMLDDAEVEIRKLEQLAEVLNVDAFAEISALNQKIGLLRNLVETDPLGTNNNFILEIKPQILQVKTTIEQVAKEHKLIRDNFAIAHQLLSQLLEIHHQALSAFTESKIKVVDHSTLQNPLTKEQIAALSSWLERLEVKFSEGLFQPVRVGLENWIVKVKEYITIEEKASTANKAPLETRAELRGRLDALQAKALARGLAEDEILSQLASVAKQLLFTRPTPLDRAAELVSQYEKKLNSFANLR